MPAPGLFLLPGAGKVKKGWGFMEKEPKEIKVTDIPAWRKLTPVVYLEKWISAIETGLDLAGAILIAFIMFFTTVGIIGRYVFNHPIYGKVEITELVMAGVVFFGIAFTQRVGGHVRMGLLVERVTKGRAYHLVEFFTLLCALFAFIIFTICTAKSALYDLSIGGITPLLYLPTWPSKLCIPIGSFFLCIRLTIQLIQHLSQAIAGVEKREL